MAAFGLVRSRDIGFGSRRFRFGLVPVSFRLEPSENVADSPDLWFRLIACTVFRGRSHPDRPYRNSGGTLGRCADPRQAAR